MKINLTVFHKLRYIKSVTKTFSPFYNIGANQVSPADMETKTNSKTIFCFHSYEAYRQGVSRACRAIRQPRHHSRPRGHCPLPLHHLTRRLARDVVRPPAGMRAATEAGKGTMTAGDCSISWNWPGCSSPLTRSSLTRNQAGRYTAKATVASSATASSPRAAYPIASRSKSVCSEYRN